MKILNLYSGIGGNRKLWGNEHEITAVEYKQEIAEIYHDFFPNDEIIIADAHDFLLNNFEKFNFIWTSPPCPSHSQIRKLFSKQNKPIYPNMKLYEEILLLQGYFKGKYVVENVISWYKPLIEPQEISKHYFWTNFYIPPYKKGYRGHDASIENLQSIKGFNLDKYPNNLNKRLLLKNCVEPELGKYIFDKVKIENGVLVEKVIQPKLL